MKKQNGITLIALVITIIVLLILAGVSIAAITGENGIVDKAKEAAEKTEAAQKEEEGILAGYEDAMDELLDEGFPYGTFYVPEAYAESTEKMGLVVYSNGKAEIIFNVLVDGSTIDGSIAVLDATLEENVLTISENGADPETYTIADDYSSLTTGSTVLNKTSKTYTYCAHNWETTDELEDSHKCSKCDMYGEHTYTENGDFMTAKFVV